MHPVKDETFWKDYTSCGHTEKTLKGTIAALNVKERKSAAREDEDEEASKEEEESSDEDE